jgi:hypothetical protein
MATRDHPKRVIAERLGLGIIYDVSDARRATDVEVRP